MVSQPMSINFVLVINDDATGTIQLGRDMPNFTFMCL